MKMAARFSPAAIVGVHTQTLAPAASSGPTTKALRHEPCSCGLHSRENARAQPVSSPAAAVACPSPPELEGRNHEPRKARPRSPQGPAGGHIARPVDAEI